MSMMRWGMWSLAALVACSGAPRSLADGPSDNQPATVRRVPAVGIEVPPEREAHLRERLARLQQQIDQLAATNAPDIQRDLADVRIFARAVRGALDYREFFAPADLDRADSLLDEGLARAERLSGGGPVAGPLRLTVRGYTSRIDGSIQPYGLVLPENYDPASGAPLRLDIWFHGRGETLSEVNFLWDRLHNLGEYAPADTIVLHPYGRYCNAFKFAGEVDVLEALQDVRLHYPVDADRISVRGFSMGGAACWQFATHYSDRWFAANPGAGFAETPQFLNVFQNETLAPTPWERTLWNLYDCDKYALNLAQCPTIAYSGEIDKQKQAADVMQEAMAEHDLRLRHIIGPQMGHRIDAGSKQTIETAMAFLANRGRVSLPPEVHFETYTLKYNRMAWVTLDALGEHWKRAAVEARVSLDAAEGAITIDFTSENVAALSFDFPAGSFIEALTTPRIVVRSDAGQLRLAGPLSDGSWSVQLARAEDGAWRESDQLPAPLSKRHNLQGPVDDALMDSFVFVRPTGQPANEAVGRWASSELDRAIEHWRRHFRGDARVVNDVDVTDELAASANLILWGDPASNAVLANIAGQLPIAWSSEAIEVGDQKYSSANHALIMVYPNPLHPDRYVVLNSSFTFRDYAYLNNARQVPMLPDWAVVNLDTPAGTVYPGEVVLADFFDESWGLKED